MVSSHVEHVTTRGDKCSIEVRGEKGVLMSCAMCGLHFLLRIRQIGMRWTHVKGKSSGAEHALNVVPRIKVLGPKVSVAVRPILNPVGEL